MTERAERDQIDGAPHPSSAIGALRRTPKDNDELRRTERRFRAAVRRLERIGGLMDALQREVERIGPCLAEPAAPRITGAGSINLIVKAEALSAELNQLSTVLRRNETDHAVKAAERKR